MADAKRAPQRIDCAPWPPMIPAVRSSKALLDLPVVRPVESKVAFLLGGKLREVQADVQAAQARGWRVFVHVDMVRGLSGNEEGLAFLREFVGPFGIISTHSQTIVHAQRVGLATVQRIFLVDSQSVATGLMQVRSAKPSAVEAMPGLLVGVLRQVAQELDCPVIAGGLVRNAQVVDRLLAGGVTAVSSSMPSLWGYARPIEARVAES